MAKKVSYFRKRADKSMQEYYQNQHLKCEICNNPAVYKHHFFTKSSSSYLRYDERNLISICNRCHFRHHNTSDPTIHATIIETKGLDWYKKLRRDSSRLQKTGINYYREIIKKYEK